MKHLKNLVERKKKQIQLNPSGWVFLQKIRFSAVVISSGKSKQSASPELEQKTGKGISLSTQPFWVMYA